MADNWLGQQLEDTVWNNGTKPLVNFNFMMRVEGIYDIPLRSVHSFSMQNEYDYVQEGGVNDYVHILRKGVTKPFTFQVEQYAGSDQRLIDPLPLGADIVLPILLFVGDFPGAFTTTRRTYTFTGCSVIAKEYGELSAEKSGFLTETTTIAFREMSVLDLSYEDVTNLFNKKGK